MPASIKRGARTTLAAIASLALVLLAPAFGGPAQSEPTITYAQTFGHSGSGSYGGAAPPPDHFKNPSGVAVDGSGNVYVADTDQHRVLKFSSDGTYLSTFGVGGVFGSNDDNFNFKYPTGVAVDGSGSIYVADTYNHRVQKFDSSGTYLATLGVTRHPGWDNFHFNYPTGVAVDGSGNIYVADNGTRRLQIFDSTGNWLRTFGGWSYGVAVDGSGNVFIADTNNHRVQKFSSAGTWLATLGVTGVADSDNVHFDHPSGVAVDESGSIYVADSGNNRVQKFTQTEPAPLPSGPILGTSGNDTIQGTPGNDVIFALAGNDTVYGNGGDDLIVGGKGNDKLFGLDGNDTLKGGAGTDRCVGGAGKDVAKKCEKLRSVP